MDKLSYFLERFVFYLWLIALIVGAIFGLYWLTGLGVFFLTLQTWRMIYQRCKLKRPWNQIPYAPYGIEYVIHLVKYIILKRIFIK
jgi:hypothetical protein